MKDAYPIITTNAFVVHTSAYREFDRGAVLFTEDLGKISARAISVRKDAAKLRGIIYPYRFLKVTLIDCNDYIVKEGRVIDPLFSIWECDLKKKAYVKSLSLINKLVSGYSGENLVFNDLCQFVYTLKDCEKKFVEGTSLAAMLLFLSRLGYVEGSILKMHTLKSLGEMLTNSSNEKYNVIKTINEGLLISNL